MSPLTRRQRCRRGARTSPAVAAAAAAGFLLVSSSSTTAAAAAFSPSSPSGPLHLPTSTWGSRRGHCCRSIITPRVVAADATAEGEIEIAMPLKLEAAAVKRFATGYDKLCKNCPTRLAPRVDTLTEMILGLTDEERLELLSTVESKVEEREGADDGRAGGTQTAREVYDYQLDADGASLVLTAKKTKAKKIEVINGTSEKAPTRNGAKDTKRKDAEKEKSNKRSSSADDLAAVEAKLDAKLAKSRSKLDKSRLEHSRTTHLLAVASLLLTDGPDAPLPPAVVKANDCNAFADELRSMDPEELILQKFKYDATRAKYEGKMAKARVKMFAANLELSRVHALRAEREQEEQKRVAEKAILV